MPPHAVPRKPLGTFYAVVLRTPDFSHGNVARKGGLAGEDVVPIPEFGAARVCCNGDALGRTQRVELTAPGGHFPADPVDVPICAACAEHAVERTGASMMAGAALCVGVPVAVLGFFFYDLPAVGVAGLAITTATVAWLLRSRGARLARTRGGHHPGLSLLVAPRQCVVRTSNRAFAERVVAANADRVFRVK
jgi:hypothetical protein